MHTESWIIEGEERPAPAHRKGWRALVHSPGLRAMAIHQVAFSMALASLHMIWSAFDQIEMALMWIVVVIVLGVASYTYFVRLLKRMACVRFQPEARRWILHMMRLVGEDPDPLFLDTESLLRAFDAESAHEQAKARARELDATTAPTLGQASPVSRRL